MLKALIFDFDGVIADTERLHLAGFRHALAAHDIQITDGEYFERYLGFDDRDGFAQILADRGRSVDGEGLSQLIGQKAVKFEELVRERVVVFDGVRELMADCKREPKLAVGIGSGALRGEIELVLKLTGLSDFIDVIVAADDVSKSKPDPETFLSVLSELRAEVSDLEPHHCVVIEDSHAGIESAVAAGMSVIAVTNSFDAGAFATADRVVDSLTELSRESIAPLCHV